MTNPRNRQLFITVLFVAVVLSCTAYFGITALIALPDSFVDEPYREDAALPETLNAFDRCFYLDRSLRELLIANDYRIFGQVADRSVFVGRDDFLFPLTGERESGYAYLEDYAGNLRCDEDTLDLFAKSLTKRSISYKNQGAVYLLAVIPNLQTVYPEKLPIQLSGTSGETRLEQLSAYLAEYSDAVFLDLTQPLLDAKEEGQLYNNTEDSLNALGAFAVYRAVMEAMPDDVRDRITAVTAEDVDIFTRYTTGKALARTAGVSTLVRNRTLSLSNDTVLKYQTLERIAGMEITYVKPEYKNTIKNRPALLLEFSDEWDKIQLMPYFSNTFGVVGYKTNPAYSQMGVDYLSPAVVVQFIHESELDALLDETIMLSYNDGLNPGDDPFTAMTPIVLATAQSGPDRICIIGRCEEGSTVRITGKGVRTAEVTTEGERFILDAVLEGSSTAWVELCALVPNKADSMPAGLMLSLKWGKSESTIRAGTNSMLFRVNVSRLPDYVGYSQTQLWRIVRRFEEKACEISTMTGKQTQLVYAYIPDKINVYGDALGDAAGSLVRQWRLNQLTEALANSDSVTAIDLTQTLCSARTSGLQYCQTGTGLTPLGAFSAYRAIFQQLSDRDPALTPRHRSDYQLNVETCSGGDLIEALGLDGASLTEQMAVLTPNQTTYTRTGLTGGENPADEEALLYRNQDTSLPVAVVLRDAYGTPLLPYLAEHFSCLYVLEENDFNLTEEFLKEVRPDYIFRLTSEYNLPLN